MSSAGVRILVLNAGSSTLKAAVLEVGAGIDPGDASIDLLAVTTSTRRWADDPGVPATLAHVLAEVDVSDPGALAGIGHRVVHGGTDLLAPTRVDAGLVGALEALMPLAPLHLPPAIATLGAMSSFAPDVPQVACFDTAFHNGLPEVDRTYPVPPEWQASLGLRRFGFHGLSVDWAVRRAAVLLGRPVAALGLVVAHLGAGASVTAVEGGRSVHTSMGYTPLEGLVMATRSGSLDPGIVTAMARAGHAPDDLEADLQQRSGLLALAGTADMREILDLTAVGHAGARLALEVFVDRAAAGIAAAATRLRRMDALVLTGGIGEASPVVRAAIVARLGVLGIAPVDDDATPVVEHDRVLGAGSGARPVREPGAGPVVVRVAAREDRIIAAAVRGLTTTEP